MPYELKARNVLITGGSRGLGALIVEKFAKEGSNVAINYQSSKDAAQALADKVHKDHGVKAIVLQGDGGVIADCERLVKQTIEGLGGIDVIIGNAGWTKQSTFGDLDGNSEEDWDKCYAVNVKGQMAVLRAALPAFNANPDGGAFIITSSVAGVAASGSSMPYAVTKAAGLHLMKCLATTQGPKVRVNAVLPGLLLTEWATRVYSQEAQDSIKQKAVLKQETLLDDCADAFIYLAKNASATSQAVQVDSGLFPVLRTT